MTLYSDTTYDRFFFGDPLTHYVSSRWSDNLSILVADYHRYSSCSPEHPCFTDRDEYPILLTDVDLDTFNPNDYPELLI